MGDIAEWAWDAVMDAAELVADIWERTPPFLWITADGERIPIGQLRTAHLARILNLIVREGLTGSDIGRLRVRRLKAEAKKRGFLLLPTGYYSPPTSDPREDFRATP